MSTLKVGDRVEVLRREYLVDGVAREHYGSWGPRVGEIREVDSVTRGDCSAAGNVGIDGYLFNPDGLRLVEDEVDHVDHPPHYTWGPVEVIEITEHLSFCMGNVVKYVLRADHKGNPIEDLKKARWYLDREISRRESEAS